MSTEESLRAGLDYIALGWPVLVLHHPRSFGPKRGPGRATCSCAHTDCTSQGKHPRTMHGLEDATLDADVFTRALERWPAANIGIRSGDAFDALDIDSEEALRALARLIPAAGEDGASGGPMVRTGRGWQLYWLPTGGGNAVGLVRDVDWRGRGGYVVAPPSIHHTGSAYAWEVGCGPDAPLVPVPDWLAVLLAKPSVSTWPQNPGHSVAGEDAYVVRAIERAAGRVLLAPEGRRNDELNRAAFSLGKLVMAGRLDTSTAVSALLRAAGPAGLGQRESEATIASGLRAGASARRRQS